MSNSGMRLRFHPALLSIPVALALALVYGPAFLPLHTFADMDFSNLFYPHALVAREAFSSGRIPLWNFYVWGGVPLLAAAQGSVLYPPMWLVLLLPLPFGLQLSILAHLVFAGVGAARLAQRHLDLPPAAALYAAVAWPAGAFMFGHLEQVPIVATISWTPWILLTGLNLIRSKGGMLPLTASAAMAMLAGHPQFMVLALLGLAAWGGLLVLAQILLPEEGHQLPGLPRWRAVAGWEKLLIMLIAVGVAGAVAAAQILPTQELGRLSERVWPWPDPHAPALEGRLLAGFVFPHYFHSLAGIEKGRPLGFTELGLYAGLLSAPLFLAGTAWILRKRSPAALALLGTWALAFYFAFGSVRIGDVEVGLAPLVHRVVPFLAHSRGSGRSLSVASLLFVVIAAGGLHQTGRFFFSSVRSRAFAAGLLTALTAADLAWTHRGELLSRLAPADYLSSQLPPAVQNQIRPRAQGSSAGPDRIYRMMARDGDYYLDNRPQALLQRRVRLQPNLNVVEKRATLDGYEEGLLPLRAYANFLRHFNRNLRSPSPDPALLALMGSNRMLAEYPVAQTTDWAAEGTPFQTPTGPLQLWKSRFPAAWFLDKTALQESGTWKAADYATFTNPSVRLAPQTEPEAHGYENLTPAGFQEAVAAAAVVPAGRLPNSIQFKFRSPAGRPRPILVLQQPYPGWKVIYGSASPALKGKSISTPLHPLSPIFSEFLWPPGDFPGAGSREGALVFAPFSFRLGLFISLSALAFLAGSRGTKLVQQRRQRLTHDLEGV